MTRRKIIGFCAGLFSAVGVGKLPLFGKKKAIVETLEHEGWSYGSYEGRGESKYVTQWTFDSEEEAREFVLSLIPRLKRVWVAKNRAPVSPIDRMEVELVSCQKDGSEKLVLENRRPWLAIHDCWAYLMCMRINGKPVSRATGSSKQLSDYLTQPFLKGNAEIIEVK